MSAPPEIDTQRCGDPGLEMRRESHCRAPGEVLRDQILHTLHSRDVERRKRLIQDPQRHSLAQGQARERDAPPLALRQHPRRQIFATAKAELAKRLADPRGLHRNAGKRARNAQILGRSQVILDRAGVSDVDELPPELLLQPPDILARPAYLAAGRLEQRAYDSQEARLARAVGSSDAEQLAAA